MDWLVLAGAREADIDFFELLASSARVVKPGGRVNARLRGGGLGADDGAKVRNLVERIADLSGRRLGDVVGVDLVALGKFAAGMLRADGGFELTFTPKMAATDAGPLATSVQFEAPEAAGAGI